MQIKQNMIFQLGQHTLACGDSLDKEFVKKVINEDVISSIQTDPPYGVSIANLSLNPTKHRGLVNDHIQSDDDYAKFTQDWLEAVKPFLANKNSVYIFNCDKMIFALREAMIKSGFRFEQLLIWVKNQPVIGRLNYLPMHELIAYGWYGTHNFYKSQDKSVLFYPKPQQNKYHPTMKPIGLIRNLILNSTKINDMVYDPFLGSGTTLLACEQTIRKCIGIEIDPDYCQIVINRWEKLTRQNARKMEEKI